MWPVDSVRLNSVFRVWSSFPNLSQAYFWLFATFRWRNLTHSRLGQGHPQPDTRAVAVLRHCVHLPCSQNSFVLHQPDKPIGSTSQLGVLYVPEFACSTTAFCCL